MLGIYRIFFVGIILTGIFMANSLFLKQVDAEDGAFNQGPMVVVLERHYLDGDKSEEIIIENLSASEIKKNTRIGYWYMWMEIESYSKSMLTIFLHY